MRSHPILAILLLVLLSSSAFASETALELAERATSRDRADSERAVKALRGLGREGLEALFERYASEIKSYSRTGKADENWPRISQAIDRVARQKDAYASRLFWYTDYEEAKREASKSGKLVLSLRLLGDLDEEYSCANSRLFRSVLYSDPSISKLLGEKFVLHWQSVRPAPKMTIEFGDGRRVVRTVTGNSIHYVLSAEGKVVDAFPGLYSPGKFLEYLNAVNSMSRGRRLSNADLNRYRVANYDRLVGKFRADSAAAGLEINTEGELPTNVIRIEGSESVTSTPTALDAAPVAVTKAMIETISLRASTIGIERFSETAGLEQWETLAESMGAADLSPESRRFVNIKSGNGPGNETSSNPDLINNLERAIAIDTAKNEYLYHTRIYRLIEESNRGTLDELNERIYSELFLTPSSDPWLGLYSPDVYSALDGNGVVN